MKPGSVLVNVARGEIIDEDALYDALQRDHLRGAALDVYVGEFERPPPARLWRHERVLITPHISGGSDESRHGGIGIFCDNLRAYLDGGQLRNVIDWQRDIDHSQGPSLIRVRHPRGKRGSRGLRSGTPGFPLSREWRTVRRLISGAASRNSSAATGRGTAHCDFGCRSGGRRLRPPALTFGGIKPADRRLIAPLSLLASRVNAGIIGVSWNNGVCGAAAIWAVIDDTQKMLDRGQGRRARRKRDDRLQDHAHGTSAHRFRRADGSREI